MLGPMAISNIIVPISDTLGYFKSIYLCLDCLSGFRVCCLDIAQKQNICTLVVFLPIGSLGLSFVGKPTAMELSCLAPWQYLT
jgi:hypothetical protein